MIIIGYPCIGKTTVCNEKNTVFKYIDLDPNAFYNDNGVRPPNWYIFYCNLAEILSKQNCLVFVCSDKQVRERLKESKENVVCIFPSINLKNEWLTKLEARYKLSNSDKDYNAWKDALTNFENSITEMKTSGFPCIEIESMNYELRNLVINYELSLISSSIKND